MMVIAIIIILGLLAIYLYLGFYAMKRAIKRRKTKELMNEEAYKNYQDYIKAGKDFIASKEYLNVWINSDDNISLHAKYYNNHSDTTLILFHGYRSSGEHDFSGIFIKYYELGYNILLCDHRAHGQSQGKYIGYGILERYDCKRWCEYIANETPNVNIILGGISMGATTVVLASALDLPHQVKGIVADSLFTSPDEIVRVVVKRMHILPVLIVPLMDFYCRIFAKYHFKDASTIDAIKKSDLPIFLIHGESDKFVPYQMSVDTYSARPNNTFLFLAPDADHGLSYVIDKEGYEKVLEQFFTKIVQNEKEIKN